MRYLVVALPLLMLSAPIQAADLSGDWRGAIELPGEEMPAFLRLEQDNGTVTGQAGPNEERLFPIKRATLNENRLNIETSADSPVLLVFELTIEGEDMSGRVFEGGAPVGTVKLRRAQ